MNIVLSQRSFKDILENNVEQNTSLFHGNQEEILRYILSIARMVSLRETTQTKNLNK